uniref:Uncharacterized protein n=1 Tax=Oryza sativa subsp. japonica TaxID=39947 RepID=Q6ERI0_ORYSJ|nr:hypothetical protein [Oryza sativa Japonica Group]
MLMNVDVDECVLGYGMLGMLWGDGELLDSNSSIIHDGVSTDMVSAAADRGNGGIVLSMIKNWLRS